MVNHAISAANNYPISWNIQKDFVSLQQNCKQDIQNGTEDIPRFNLSEHAGLSKGGAPLIGASIIACYAAASLAASCNAEGREGGPVNDEFLSSFQNSYLLSARMSASRSSILAVGS